MKVHVVLYQDKLHPSQTKELLLLHVADSEKLAKDIVEKTIQTNNGAFNSENFEIHEVEVAMAEPSEEEAGIDEAISEYTCAYCHTPLPVSDCHYAAANGKHYHFDCLRKISG